MNLKQVPRALNKKLDSELKQLQFTQSNNEACSSIIILAVYVDDMLMFWNNREELLTEGQGGS